MNWYSFIFSEKKIHRLRRHVILWSLWWMYFTASYYHYEQAGLQKIEFEPWNLPFFIKSILLLSVHVIACYLFTNYLMTRYLFKRRYVALVIQMLVLSCFILLTSYFLHKAVFPLVNDVFNYKPVITNQNILWTSISSGILSAPKVISAAVAVKLIKRWYLKQKEKERLEQEKLITDLQLLKAQIHPDFLFSSLNNICSLVRKKDVSRASSLLLKLADILSYMLYECENAVVSLEEEIRIIKDYLVLQNNIMDKRLDIDIAEKGEITGQMIAPLLLLPFIENSFAFMGDRKLETNWINLEFHVENTIFTMKLIHGKSTEYPGAADQTAIVNATRRLDHFYSNHYQLKTTIEPEIMMTLLKITLNDKITENDKIIHTEQVNYAIA
jgi:sensor histidine kinase YesM